ncbi:MAG: hypothetical protein AB7E12_07575 [Burkholderiaceae bacterium]
MSDFNPVSVFYIAWETLAAWFWPLLVAGVALFIGVMLGLRRLRKARRSATRPVVVALLWGLAATALGTLALPYLTHAPVGVLASLVDFLVAFLLALVLGAAVFAVAFTVAAHRYTAGHSR